MANSRPLKLSPLPPTHLELADTPRSPHEQYVHVNVLTGTGWPTRSDRVSVRVTIVERVQRTLTWKTTSLTPSSVFIALFLVTGIYFHFRYVLSFLASNRDAVLRILIHSYPLSTAYSMHMARSFSTRSYALPFAWPVARLLRSALLLRRTKPIEMSPLLVKSLSLLESSCLYVFMRSCSFTQLILR